MVIEEVNTKTKCDFVGCNNLAEYSFSTKGLLKHELCFCEDCLKGMYEAIGQVQIPKGTKSPFKLNERLRRKDENQSRG